ncbi:MAG TPA: hypothetical protein VGK73_20055 [Polyangiaceae bacterium]
MQRSIQHFMVAGLVFGGVGLGAAGALSETVEGLLRRYPYDPACLWGRLANGKGTVLRCLTEQEAGAIAAAVAAQPAVPSVAPAASVPAPAATETAPVKPGRYELTVGPVVADKGELGVGKLGAPKDRYAKCLEDNGGLRGESGEVHVRFLVRSKGIAEGVSVQKRLNVSAEAARCIAEVVDRRYVGVPDEPLVGATLQIKIAGRP